MTKNATHTLGQTGHRGRTGRSPGGIARLDGVRGCGDGQRRRRDARAIHELRRAHRSTRRARRSRTSAHTGWAAGRTSSTTGVADARLGVTSASAGVPPAAEQAAAPKTAGVDFSTTNVQEAGVDEPDIVKSDGNRIFAIAKNRLYAVDVSGSTPRIVGSLAMPTNSFARDMLISANKLVVMGDGPVMSGPAPASRPVRPPATRLPPARRRRHRDRPRRRRLRDHRDRRHRRGRDEGAGDVPDRGPLRHRAHERHHRPDRRRGRRADGHRVCVPQRAGRRRRSRGRPSQPQPADPYDGRQLDPALQRHVRGRHQRTAASGGLRGGQPSTGVLGSRHADGADGRPDRRPGPDRRRRGDGKRRERLRVAPEPLRRNQPLGGP